MKKLLCLMVLGLALVSTMARAAFIEGMEDVPLMSGLTQLQSSNIAFGNEETRFTEAYLSGKVASFKKIAKFYKDTLPQLGWKFVSQKGKVLHFERDADVLDIAQEKASPLLLRITIKSKD